AKAFLDMRMFKKSKALIEKVLQLDPANTQATAMAQEIESREKIDEFKQLVAQDPGFLDLRVNLGDLYLKVGRFKEAFSEFSECMRVHIERGQMDQASALVQKMPGLEEELARLKEAAAKSEDASPVSPTNPSLESPSATRQPPPPPDITATLPEGMEEEAKKNASGTSVHRIKNDAERAFEEGDLAKAIALYQEVVRLDPED